ncbi:MAG: SDR family oxidoreductase [Synergistaceae bacterium]|nr:SDR family oxidoreductase [Synergistaceae bacterium]
MKGKVCIVTGAASGIGRCVSDLFAEEGATLALVDLQEESGHEVASAINARGQGSARFYACDVRSVGEIRGAVDAVKSDFGRVDVLANIAGVSRRTPLIEAVTEEDWDAITSVNLKGAFFMAQSAYRVMLEQGHGKIINMGSTRAMVSDEKHVVYDATKGGIHAITRSFAVAGGPKGIVTNTVAPGYVLTPMTEHNLNNDGWMGHLRERVPIGRMVEMREVAEIVLFVASDRCGGVNGSVFVVDGGRMAHD